MKISELIKELLELKEGFGDIEVMQSGDSEGNSYEYSDGASFRYYSNYDYEDHMFNSIEEFIEYLEDQGNEDDEIKELVDKLEKVIVLYC